MNDRLKYRTWDEIYMTYIMDIRSGNFEYLSDNIFMQCTGLEDSKGRIIYEGDILTIYETGCGNDHPKGRKVLHSIIVKLDPLSGFFSDVSVDGKWTEIEVIGNIHENPELLEAK